MRKILISILATFLSFILVMPINIQAASASLTGTSTVRAGDTIYVTLNVSASKMSGIQATVTYDKSALTFLSYSNKLSSRWSNSYNHSGNTIKIVAYDQNNNYPLNSASVAVLKFKVSSDAATGSSFSIKVSGSASDASANSLGGFSSTYTRKIVAPLSGNDNLSYLKVANANISPAFNPNTEVYSTSVPFTTSSLSISAKAAVTGAKVYVSNNKLVAGKTTHVKITVTAPNGNKKTYTIKATREQDPNYVPSKENKLKSIKIEGFYISPIFNSDNLNYIVYLPYEVDKLEISAIALDSLSTISISENEGLEVGENVIKVKCIAENGDERVYSIIAQRASMFAGQDGNAINKENQSLIQTMKAITDKDLEKTHRFYLNLIGSTNKLVDSTLFEELKRFKDATLVIQIENGTITFASKDLNNIEKKQYDFSYINVGVNNDKIKASLKGGEAYVFSLGGEASQLPSYATFSIITTLNPGSEYMVYQYDATSDKFSTIANKIVVDSKGYITFNNNYLTDYVITSDALTNAIESEALKHQPTNSLLSMSNEFMIILGAIAVVSLLLGFAFGHIPQKRKLKNYIKRRSSENAKRELLKEEAKKVVEADIVEDKKEDLKEELKKENTKKIAKENAKK